MTRPDIRFCPFCGSEKVTYERARLRCYGCGRLFEVDEMVLLRVATPIFPAFSDT